MSPDHYLSLAREAIATPGGAERHWRAATRFAYDAVFLLVAGAVDLDPTTFAGNTRAVREALAGANTADAPAFIKLARRHWNTLWLAGLRAERALDDTVTEAEARLCVALAERVFAARTAGLQ